VFRSWRSVADSVSFVGNVVAQLAITTLSGFFNPAFRKLDRSPGDQVDGVPS